MPLKPEKPKMPLSNPRKDSQRDLQRLVVENVDTAEGGDRDLAHGEGGTLGVPNKPADLNHDD